MKSSGRIRAVTRVNKGQHTRTTIQAVRARACARNCTGPVVFQTRKSAPWPVSTSNENSPASVVYQSKTPGRFPGRKSVNKGMANSPVASTGTPRTTFPRDAPRTTARSEELTAKTVSQNSRPRGSSAWERNSIETPRKIKQPEHDHEGHVEPAERGRVEPRECHEQDAARRDQPHLVPVPERADGGEDGPSLQVGPGDQAVQGAHSEIEAVKDRVDGQHQGHDGEPDPFHGCLLARRHRAAHDFSPQPGQEKDAEHEIQAREAERREDHVPGVDRRG